MSKYKKIPRKENGQPDRAADAPQLIDISNIKLWRDALNRSGYPIDELPLPTTITEFSTRQLVYNRERSRIIMEELPHERIHHYCHLYNIRIHSRRCPAYFGS